MIEREVADKVLALARQFPVVSVTGPRQSGKSTLVQALFPDFTYVSLEDEDVRAFALDDPRAFLARYGRRTVLSTTSPARGAQFETSVVEEVAKAYLARGRKPKLFYWRDAAGHKIDILIERGASLAWAIEVKNSATYSPKFFKNLDAVCDDIDVPVERRVVVYAGQETFETSHGLVCSFADLRRLDV